MFKNPFEGRDDLVFGYLDTVDNGLDPETLQSLVAQVGLWNIETGHMDPDPYLAQERFWEDPSVQNLALDLIYEEVEELEEAVRKGHEIDALDAIADILFTVFGLAAKAGLAEYVTRALNEVIFSNNTKIPLPGEERTVLPGGKIGKREGYVPPDLYSITQSYEERLVDAYRTALKESQQ